ncbi:DgsA anti-repressor MtfA, partial [Escherichia coli]|nr:DgsA anti-repressor MtfA [Escherichia coli]
MIKWPRKVQESAHQTALPWQEALTIPLLTCLSDQDES